MKNLFGIFIAFLLLQITTTVKAQDQKDPAASMKAWTDFMTPGDIHKMLAKNDGKWTTETTMWMSADAAPIVNKGTCINKMILGGRYQESTFSGSFMGKPFEGIATNGYDNGKKIFVSTWVDNVGTGIMMLEGTWNDATKTVDLRGHETDPMTGKDMQIHETLKIIDENNQLMTMYDMYNGKEVKIMEIKMMRAIAKK